MNEVACVIIASENRKQLVYDKVLPSVTQQDFAEVILVADWEARGGFTHKHLRVAPLTRTTTDALVKRDVGTLATRSPNIVYLCDDHALAPHFLTELGECLNEGWDVLVPNRYIDVPVLAGDATGFAATGATNRVHLNMGERESYCGGHAGVFKRHVITARPWASHTHDRLWDKHSSHWMIGAGYKFCWRPRADIAIIDLEPERKPWL